MNKTYFHQKGSSWGRTGKFVTSKDISNLEMSPERGLKAYMVFGAKEMEAILPMLRKCPALESPKARIEILPYQPNMG